MNNNSKLTSSIDMLELRERVNIRFKAAHAEEKRAFCSMFDESGQRAERSRIDYLLALGKQEAFESILTLIDSF